MVQLNVLTPGLRRVICVTEHMTLREALTIMEVDAVSRIPIFRTSRRRSFTGMIRRKDILRLFLSTGAPDLNLKVKDYPAAREAMQGSVIVDASASFFDVMEKFNDASEVLITEEGVFEYILTSKGVALWWARYAEPFIVVEKLEKTLRAILKPFEGEQLECVCRGPLVDQLNPSDYQAAFSALWDNINPHGLDRTFVLRRLQEFAEFRNRLMHFRLNADVDDDRTLKEDITRLKGLQRALNQRGLS